MHSPVDSHTDVEVLQAGFYFDVPKTPVEETIERGVGISRSSSAERVFQGKSTGTIGASRSSLNVSAKRGPPQGKTPDVGSSHTDMIAHLHLAEAVDPGVLIRGGGGPTSKGTQRAKSMRGSHFLAGALVPSALSVGQSHHTLRRASHRPPPLPPPLGEGGGDDANGTVQAPGPEPYLAYLRDLREGRTERMVFGGGRVDEEEEEEEGRKAEAAAQRRVRELEARMEREASDDRFAEEEEEEHWGILQLEAGGGGGGRVVSAPHVIPQPEMLDASAMSSQGVTPEASWESVDSLGGETVGAWNEPVDQPAGWSTDQKRGVPRQAEEREESAGVDGLRRNYAIPHGSPARKGVGAEKKSSGTREPV
ncbi:hypothetical protein T484DRAFT_2400897 [Baffinella frigidus]|nr:hypothetical protein T484DRAFT_2400897 [Cryptophyta sp. CCMP2293]